MIYSIFEQQRQKIIDAYFENKIIPSQERFCFCGTLQGDEKWNYKNENKYYTIEEYIRMESALLLPLKVRRPNWDNFIDETNPDYEEFLFKGMCASLDVLKQIHIERGEIIDEEPILKKRELAII